MKNLKEGFERHNRMKEEKEVIERRNSEKGRRGV